MAERKSQNKYYPPNWDPIHGSINRFVKNKTKTLERRRDPTETRETGRKIRFEMPFNIWCEGCENHIGMGVRYNAFKTTIGNYHSTTIFKFRMKCHLCDMWFEIHTDPQNSSYKIIGGCRRRIEDYDPTSIGLTVLPDQEERDRLENDAFYKLENSVKDSQTAETRALALDEIQGYNDKHWKDPYTVSQIVRKKFRTQKKLDQKLTNEALGIQNKFGLSLTVKPETQEDVSLAKSIDWNEHTVEDDKKQRDAVMTKPIFKSKKVDSKTNAKAILLKNIASQRRGDPFGSFM